jgi:HEAT repeat protein
MAHKLDVTRWQEELVEACKYGDEARARALVAQPGARKARDLLEDMLASPDALARQAAAWGLGELGGAASARRLEQQLALEEAREDHDGASVVEAITQALGCIEDASSRASLVRRLRRLTTGRPDLANVNTMARALWRRRHPDLRPVVRQTLEQLALPPPTSLHGLLLLLEKSPEELRAWAKDMSVPVEYKTEVLTVLAEEIPDALLPTLPSFISAAHALLETAVSQQGTASYYCEDLLSLLLLHKERVLPSLPREAHSELRAMARRLVAGVSLNGSLRAAVLLEHVGRPEDAAIIEAHRPAEPVLAKVFNDAAQALRGLQNNS